LSNTTDTMQIQNLVRARGLDDPAKLHWQSIPNENPDLAAIFDMGKQLPTPDATSTQIYLLRGLMAQLWRTPHTLEHVERSLAKHKLTPPDKRGLLAFHLHVSKEVHKIKRLGMDKDSTITSLFLKVLRTNHNALHNHIIEKYEQLSLTSPLITEDLNSQEYDPARVKIIVNSIHQAARREVPTKPEYNVEFHPPTTESTTHQ